MKLLNKIILFIVLATFTVGFAQSSEPEFSLDLKMQHDTVKIGSPIEGKVILTNTSHQDVEVYIDRGRDAHRSGFTIEFLDAQGKAPDLTAEGSVIIGFPGHRTLKPGGTVEYTSNLTNMYNVTQPGAYTVQAQILDGKTRTIVKSNTVTITLTK